MPLTVGSLRRSFDSSTTSSWMSEALWSISTEAAADITFGVTVPSKRALSSTMIGRICLPLVRRYSSTMPFIIRLDDAQRQEDSLVELSQFGGYGVLDRF